MIPDPDMKIVPDRDMRLGGAGRDAPEGFLRRYLPKIGGLAGQIVPSVAATVLGAYIVANYVNGKPSQPAAPVSAAVQNPGVQTPGAPAVQVPIAADAVAQTPERTAPAKSSVLDQLPAPVQSVIEALRPEQKPAAAREEPKSELRSPEPASAETKPTQQIRVIPLTPAPKTEARRPIEKAPEKPTKTVRREPPKIEPKAEAKPEAKAESKAEPVRSEPVRADAKPEPVKELARESVGPESAMAPVQVQTTEPAKNEARLPAEEPAAATDADAILMARRALDRMRAEAAVALPPAPPPVEAPAVEAGDATPMPPQGTPHVAPAQPAARIVDAPYRAPPPVREEAAAVPALPPPVIVADPSSLRPSVPPSRRRRVAEPERFDPDRPVPPADIPGVPDQSVQSVPPGFVIVR